jgi:hypothetical protein
MQVSAQCRGYISAAPSHVLHTRSGFQSLRLVGESAQDTTLVVMLPDGRVVCDDDGGGDRNPLIATSSTPGAIRIWVGSYAATDTGSPYQLAYTELNHVNASTLRPQPQRPQPQRPGPTTGPTTGPSPQPYPQPHPQAQGVQRVLLTPGTRLELTARRGDGRNVGVWNPNGRRRQVDVFVQSNTIVVGSQVVAYLPPNMADARVSVRLRNDGQLAVLAESRRDGNVQRMLLAWANRQAIVQSPWATPRRGRRR